MARQYAVKQLRSVPLRLGGHPDSPRTESWRQWVEGQNRPLAVDLFSGAGGLSLGLEQAGYRVILAADTDPWSLETHRHNFPGISLNIDLGDPDRLEALGTLLSGLSIDLIAGGPPCQPFSRAGRSKIRSLVQNGERPAQDLRKELWRSFLTVVEMVRPTAVLMENVPDLALGDDLAVVRKMADELELLGYEQYFKLLDAWKYGVPQHRQRFFLVAIRGAHAFQWPKARRRVTLRDAISDLPRLSEGTGEPRMRYRSQPRTAFQRSARAGMKDDRNIVWDHVTRPVRDDDREAFLLMSQNTRYSDLPKRLQRYRSDIFNDKYKKLGWDEFSRSITAHIAKDGYWYIHPSSLRTLTVREAARIQTFPDHFRFAGSRSDAFRQIGNAVPPALARIMGSSILYAISQGATAPTPRSLRRASLRTSLLNWAEEDKRLHPWRYPADAWSVLVGIFLEPRMSSTGPGPVEFLKVIGRPSLATPARFEKVKRLEWGRGQLRNMSRLEGLAGALTNRGASTEDLTRVLRLSPDEEMRFRSLALEEDRLIVNQAVLRVLARVEGTAIDRRNKLTDGRMLIGEVAGTRPAAQVINAALFSLGKTTCTAGTPACSTCPLRSLCHRFQETSGSMELSGRPDPLSPEKS